MGAGSLLGSHAVSTRHGCSMGVLATSLLGSDLQGRAKREVGLGITESPLGSCVSGMKVRVVCEVLT